MTGLGGSLAGFFDAPAGFGAACGVHFSSPPTNLALHLKQRLPSATQLRLAFQSVGPAGLPPGTQRMAIELLDYGDRSAATASWCVRKPRE